MTQTQIDAATRLRPETEADVEFLAALYASTREEEMALVTDWSDEVKNAFLRSQFDAQSLHYKEHYSAAEYWVIEREGEAVGRLYLHYQPKDLRIIDIALMPEHRRHGIGGTILRQLVADSAAAGRAVSLHVEKNNPALRLYQDLGFNVIGEYGYYFLLEWRPS
ncbi:MAG TPA: GNAT family N-acetyltransferase [Vicinamibacterales bacterium]